MRRVARIITAAKKKKEKIKKKKTTLKTRLFKRYRISMRK
jgi:hypothetical protein